MANRLDPEGRRLLAAMSVGSGVLAAWSGYSDRWAAAGAFTVMTLVFFSLLLVARSRDRSNVRGG